MVETSDLNKCVRPTRKSLPRSSGFHEGDFGNLFSLLRFRDRGRLLPLELFIDCEAQMYRGTTLKNVVLYCKKGGGPTFGEIFLQYETRRTGLWCLW